MSNLKEILQSPHFEAVMLPGDEVKILPLEIPKEKMPAITSKTKKFSRVIFPSSKQFKDHKVLMVYPLGDRPRCYPLSFIDRIRETNEGVIIYYTDPEGWTVQPDSYSKARYGFSKYTQRKK